MTAIGGRNPNVAYIGFRAEKPVHSIEFITGQKVRVEPNRGHLKREQMVYTQSLETGDISTIAQFAPRSFKQGAVQYWKLTAMDPIESVTLVEVK